jgi:hypothetical protein
MAASRNKILAVRHTRGIQSLFQLHGLGRIHGMIAVAIHNERRRQPRPHIRQWRHLLSQFQNCRARRRPSSRLSPWRSDSRIRAHIVRSSSRHGSISRQWTVERQPLVRKVGTAVFRQSLRQICRPKEIEHRRHLRLVSASRWVERCRCVCTHQREVSACGPAVQDHPAGIEVIFNGILLHPRHRAANVFNRCRSRSIFGIPVLHCHHAHPRRQQRAERPVRAWTVPSNPASSVQLDHHRCGCGRRHLVHIDMQIHRPGRGSVRQRGAYACRRSWISRCAWIGDQRDVGVNKVVRLSRMDLAPACNVLPPRRRRRRLPVPPRTREQYKSQKDCLTRSAH